ncbi:MAG: hypothetical protein WDZ45_07730 [Flavobacteriaceae bacterium]
MHEKLLNESQAAIKLGITKELLYSYVRTGVNGSKLKAISSKREIKFLESELDKFETFLKGKWVTNAKEKRPSIPKFIKEFLKVESNGQCARCFSGHRLDDAHIIPWSKSFSHFHHNLIRLCTDCHVKYDDGIISEQEINDIKRGLIEKLKKSLLIEDNLFTDSLHSIPNPDLNFVGREAYITNIEATIKGERILCVTGPGGIGKTELLIKSLEKHKQLVKWFKTEGHNSIQDLKREILIEFNSSSFSELYSFLDELGLILVFDGLENLINNDKDKTLDFIGDLFRYTSKVRLIITTQVNIEDYSFKTKSIKVKGLTKAESSLLLKSALPEFKLEDLDWVNKFSNGHVLTIKLLIGLIRFYQDSQKVKNKLKEKGVDFISSPSRIQQNIKSSLNLCLRISYEALNDSEQYILVLLTNFPGGVKEYFLDNFKKDTFFEDVNIDDFDRIVARLNQFNLIDKEFDPLNQSRLFLINPIRQFVMSEIKRKSLKTWHRLRIIAFENLMMETLAIYSHNVQTERWEYAILRYEVELTNYIYSIKCSIHSAYCEKCIKHSDKKEYLRIITGFAGGLYKYLFTRGHYLYGLKINEEGAKAHMELGEYDLALEDLTMLAQLYIRNDDMKNAQRILEQMKHCSLKINDSYKLFYIYLVEGQIIKKTQPENSINLFFRALELLSISSYDTDFKNSNTALLNAEIGRIYETCYGDFETALEYYTKASNIYNGIKDYSNLYSCFYHIGNCYSNKCDFKLSLKYYRKSLMGFMRTGQKQYIGNALSEIARLRVDYPILDYSFIDKNIINSGLMDIQEEIKLSLKTNPNLEQYHLNSGLSKNQIYKLWSIIKLASFTSHLVLINDWCNGLLNSIQNDKDIRFSYPWFFLNIALLVSQIEKKESIDENIKSIKQLCYLHGGEVEHDIFDPFKWLALWLDYKEIEKTTRGQLFAEIEIL